MSMNVALTPEASMMGGSSSRGSRLPLPHPTAPDDDPAGAAVAPLQMEGQPQAWQQQVAGTLANCPPSAAAASHAYGAAATSAAPPASSHSSGDVNGGCSSPSRGSSILCLCDLRSSQADQGGGSSEAGDQGGMDPDPQVVLPAPLHDNEIQVMCPPPPGLQSTLLCGPAPPTPTYLLGR